MFEDVTFEKILSDMLARVPDTFDKREGSIIYDALAPAAVELQNLYIQADVILTQTFADTADRDYLILRAAERGLVPHTASRTIMKAVVTPSTVLLSEGDRFNLGDYNYSVYAPYEDNGEVIQGTYLLECETVGSDSSFNTGFATPIGYIAGLQTIQITECYQAGADEEDTEDFRERYFNSLNNLASGGNIAWYRQTVDEIDGVGGVRVVTANDLNDGGRVDLYIIDNTYGVPESDDLKERVQTIIDPVQNGGEGLGLAPVGHTVNVSYAAVVSINIVITLTFASGWTCETAVNDIQKCIDDYFLELNKKWESMDNIIVRISQIESRLLDLDSIIDAADTTLNNSAKNLILDKYSIAKRGNISVTSG